jgi:hypothetical protein
MTHGLPGESAFARTCLPPPPRRLAGDLIEACVFARHSPVRGQSTVLQARRVGDGRDGGNRLDTHKRTHTAVALDELGRELGSREITATSAGYLRLWRWAEALGEARFALEGTGSYGAGLTGFLAACGAEVYECERPSRRDRRRGKSDLVDAAAAALRLLAGEGLSRPRRRREAEASRTPAPRARPTARACRGRRPSSRRRARSECRATRGVSRAHNHLRRPRRQGESCCRGYASSCRRRNRTNVPSKAGRTFWRSGAIRAKLCELTGVGSCTVTASQPGNANYNAASSVSRSGARGARCRRWSVNGSRPRSRRSQRHCRTGTVGHAYSRRIKKGVVISQSRRAGRVVPANSKINLVVSRGPRR